ncbi:MAG TPA: hypothetical protein VI258_01525, partial [Rhodanobacteraceae bacterium]
ALAHSWESRADEIVRTAERRVDRTAAARLLAPLVGEADNVADALEEVAFLLTVVPDTARRQAIATLEPLCAIVNESVREYVRALEHARACARVRAAADVDEALVSVDRIAELEHAGDRAERTARATLLSVSGDFRELQATTDIARAFEQASDAVARCARILRAYVLNPDGGTV